MNLANTAPVRAPWGGLSPEGIPSLLLEGSGVSLQLSFDLAAPPPAAPLLSPLGPLGGPWMPEARDSSRHGAELAALLVILQAEAGFQPLADPHAPPPVPEAWLAASLPLGLLIPASEGGAILPGPELLALDIQGVDARPPAPDWLIL